MRGRGPCRARPRCTSAPSSSDTFAISLMNEIFVARKAFEASLIISALRRRRCAPPAPSSGSYSAATRVARRPESLVRADHHAVGLHEVRDRRCPPSGTRGSRRSRVALRGARRIERAGADRHGALHHDRVLGRVAELLDHAPRRARGRRRPSRSAACPRTRTAAARAPSPSPMSVVKCSRSALRVTSSREAGLVDRHARRARATRPSPASMSRAQTSWPSSAKQAARDEADPARRR